METSTLEVLNTMVSEDTGLYTCLAWNQVGSDQHTVLVQVIQESSELLLFSPKSLLERLPHLIQMPTGIHQMSVHAPRVRHWRLALHCS